MRPSQLLGTADRARIEEAVREAEAGTSGEIVVAVVRACDEYGAAGWRLGALLAAATLLGVSLARPDWSPIALLASQAVALALAHALALIPALRRQLVSEAQLEHCAQREALRAFAKHGVRKTRARTGILLFVALFERRVVVLGDEAVDRALDPEESWTQVVELALSGLRRGRAADGIVLAVQRCGALLSRALPAPPDDRDEIPRGLVLED